MADASKKRIFTLQINGVNESVDAVQSLIDKLNALDSKIDSINKKSLNVNVKGANTSVETSISTRDVTKVKASDLKTAGAGGQLDLNYLKKQADLQDLLNEKNREYFVDLQRINQAKREQTDIDKQIAQGARDIEGNYTNTMAGLKAELKDLKAELNTMDLGSEQFEKTTKRIKEITDELKGLEAAYGTFGRNVGNYENGIFGGAAGKNIEDVRNKIRELEGELSRLRALTDKGIDVGINKNKIADAEKELENYKRTLQDLMKQNSVIEVQIGNTTVQYDNMRQAMRDIQNQMRALIANGKEGTSEYNNLADAFAKLRVAGLKAENTFKDLSYSMRGLHNAVELMQGITAVAGVGTGLANLFGLDGKEAQEATAKLNALLTVMVGLQQISRMKDENNSFGELLSAMSKQAEDAANGLLKFLGVEKMLLKYQNNKYGEATKRINEFIQFHSKFVEEFKKVESNTNNDQADVEFFEKFGESKYKSVDDLSESLDKLKGSIPKKEIKELEDLVLNITSDIYKFGKVTDETAAKLDEFKVKAEAFKKQTAVMSRAVKFLANTIKFLAKTLAGIGVGFVIFEIFNYAVDGIKNLVQWMRGAKDRIIELERSTTKYKTSVDAINRSLDKEIELLERQAKLNQITESDKLTKQTEAYKKALEETIDTIQDYYKNTENVADGTEKLQKVFSNKILRSLQDAEAEYEKLLNQNSFERFFSMAGKNMNKAGQYIIDSYIRQWQALDKTNTDNIQKFIDTMNNDRILQTVLFNFSNSLDEERQKSAEVFTNFIKDTQGYINSLNNATDGLTLEQKARNEKIEDNRIAAMAEGAKKRRAMRERDRKREIEEASGDAELIASINAKYDRQAINDAKATGAELVNVSRQIAANRIAAMDEGLKKTLASLRQSEKEELENAKGNAELRKSIEEKYNKQILDARKQYYDDMLQSQKDYNRQLKQIENSTDEGQYEFAKNAVNARYQSRLDAERFDEDINSRVDYHNKVKDLETKQANELLEIEKERLEAIRKENINAENERYEDLRQSIEKTLELAKNSGDEENQKSLNKQLQENERQHLRALSLIERQGQQDINRVVNDALKERSDITKKALNEQINEYDGFASKVQNRLQNTLQTNEWGFTTSEWRKGLKTAETDVKTAIEGIDQTLSNAKREFEKGNLTFLDYNDIKEQGNRAKESLSSDLKDIRRNIKENIETDIAAFNQYFTAAFQGLGDVLGWLNERAMAELDYQRDMLDKENELLDKKLQEQEDITSRHKERIDEIEDELKTARGDRRDALIDALNEQIAAQRKSLVEEQKIEKQKEALKQKEDAIELERKKKQREQDILQAIISTALATANGLATKPFVPVGIAMGSLATSLGLAQIAIMRSTKYAEGGLLKGKDHAHGGIKTPYGELEGNEFVINKSTTMKNLSLIDFINSNKKKLDLSDFINYFNKTSKPALKNTSNGLKFANGGLLERFSPERNLNLNIKSVVAVKDIIDATDGYNRVQVLAGSK